jgi:hypothetical protein
MKIWLPDSLYRLKPLLLILLGVILLLASKHILLSLLALSYMGYGAWIMIVRFMWKDKTIVGHLRSARAGYHKTHYIDM